MVLGQQGSALSDTINHPANCLSGGYGSGTVTGSTVSFTVTCAAGCGQLEFDYTGSVTGDTMSGKYIGAAAGTCPALTGTWTVTRQ